MGSLDTLFLAVAVYAASWEGVLLRDDCVSEDEIRPCLARISLTFPTTDGRPVVACEAFEGNEELVRCKSSAVVRLVEVGRCSL